MSDRIIERLGTKEVGIVMYSKMIDEQIKGVEGGREPIYMHRDPPKNECITLATEHTFYPGYARPGPSLC